MEEKFLDVRGTRIHLQTAGTGEALVFFHGAGGSAWAPGLSLLAERYEIPAFPPMVSDCYLAAPATNAAWDSDAPGRV